MTAYKAPDFNERAALSRQASTASREGSRDAAIAARTAREMPGISRRG